MALRRNLVVLAMFVLIVGVPAAYSAAAFDLRQLAPSQLSLLLSFPPLVALSLACTSIVPSRTFPHSIRDDIASVCVGSVSLLILAAGLTAVAVGAVI